MRIKRGYQISNDQSVIEYRLKIHKDEIETIEKPNKMVEPTPKAMKETFQKMEKQIPDEEKILDKYPAYFERGDEGVFIIHTKKKTTIKKQEEIKEILKKNKIKVEPYNITVDAEDEAWVEIDPEIRYTRNNLEKIMKLINAKDYEVTFDSFMGSINIIYDLK